MKKMIVITSLLVLASVTGCKSKAADKAEGKAKASGGGLAGLLKGADHRQLATLAREGKALADQKKCDAAVAKGKQAIAILKKLVPSLGAVAGQAIKDKALGDYLGDLYAIRGTLEMATASYAKEKPGALNIQPVYCKAVGSDLAKVKQDR